MKYIFNLIFLISFSISCKSQTVVDISDVQPDHTGIYYKDLYGVYNPYLGTWENTTGNITFRLTLYKKEKVAFGYQTKYYKDKIYGKFLIIENAGEIDEVIICNSDNFEPKEQYPYNIIIATANTTLCGGTIEDPCAIVPSFKPSLTGEFNFTLINSNTALWKLRLNGIHLSGLSFSIPTDATMTKIN